MEFDSLQSKTSTDLDQHDLSYDKQIFLLFDELNGFKEDLYDAMTEGKDLFMKYQKLIMVFPGGKEPEERVNGFLRFCQEQRIESEN